MTDQRARADANNINHVAISGYLSRDPELRATSSGRPVLEMGVCVNDRVKDQQTGEWGSRPNFLDVIVWGNYGESLAHLLTKGAKVAIDGRLRWTQWETQDGQKRSRVTVVASMVELMQQPRDAAPASRAASRPQAGGPPPDDDIPF